MEKLEKIFIIGGGASGKDYLKDKLIKMGLIADVSYTTRPPRDGEIDGRDYHFISTDAFNEMIENSEMLQWNEFGGNLYGTGAVDFIRSQVFILTFSALDEIIKFCKDYDLSTKGYMIIYLNISEDIRKHRMVERGYIDEQINERLRIDEASVHGYLSKEQPFPFAYVTTPFVDIEQGIISCAKNLNLDASIILNVPA